jgi:DNA-directed RNA polymerase sigma subunit (sigma70/sigma32)
MKKLLSNLQQITQTEMVGLEKKYLVIYAKQGDQAARDCIFNLYMKEIVAIAREQTSGQDIYLLIEEGCLGLVFAIHQFQPEKDDEFDRFALNHIRQNMMRSLLSLACA